MSLSVEWMKLPTHCDLMPPTQGWVLHSDGDYSQSEPAPVVIDGRRRMLDPVVTRMILSYNQREFSECERLGQDCVTFAYSCLKDDSLENVEMEGDNRLFSLTHFRQGSAGRLRARQAGLLDVGNNPFYLFHLIVRASVDGDEQLYASKDGYEGVMLGTYNEIAEQYLCKPRRLLKDAVRPVTLMTQLKDSPALLRPLWSLILKANHG